MKRSRWLSVLTAAVASGAAVVSGCIGVSATKPGAAAPVLKQCAGAVVDAPNGLIDDFEDGNTTTAAIAGRGGYWWKSADPMGSYFGPEEWGPMPEGGSLALHPLGETVKSTDPDAWGAQLGGNLVGSGFYDGSAYVGIAFRIRVAEGSTRQIRFQLADVNTHPSGNVCSKGCWNHFGKDLMLTTEWQDMKLLFSDLRQEEGWGNPRPPSVTPASLFSVGFKVKSGSKFDFFIDDVRFLGCE